MEQTNSVHPLTRITWKLNEEEGLLDVYGHFLSEEGKVQACKVASLALGTGYIVWSDQAYARDELLCNEWDTLNSVCWKYPIHVGGKINSMLKELVALNEKRAKLASDVAKLLDDRYELGLQDNMLEPLQMLTSSDFVSGTVREQKDGEKALIVEGHRHARENGAMVFSAGRRLATAEMTSLENSSSVWMTVRTCVSRLNFNVPPGSAICRAWGLF